MSWESGLESRGLGLGGGLGGIGVEGVGSGALEPGALELGAGSGGCS